MRLENQGLSLWYSTSDAPAPEATVSEGATLLVTVGMLPADASNRVEVRYRVNQAAVQTVSASWFRNDVSSGAQYFAARLPAFRAGDLVEFQAVATCAGRRVPSPKEAAAFASSFQVVRAEDKATPTPSLAGTEAGAVVSNLASQPLAPGGADWQLLGAPAPDAHGSTDAAEVTASVKRVAPCADRDGVGSRSAGTLPNAGHPGLLARTSQYSTPVVSMKRPAAARLAGSRALSGSLPLDLRLTPDGGAELRPAIMCGPLHPRAAQQASWHTAEASVSLTASPQLPIPGARGAANRQSTAALASDGATEHVAVGGQDAFAAQAAALLADPGAGTAATATARAADASFDFDQYILLRDRDDPVVSASYPQPIPADPRFERFLGQARAGISDAVNYALLPLGSTATTLGSVPATLGEQLYAWWLSVCAARVFDRLARYDTDDIAALLPGSTYTTPGGYYGLCLGAWLQSTVGQLMTTYFAASANAIANRATPDTTALDGMFTEAFWDSVYTDVFATYFEMLSYADPAAAKGAYSFDPLPPDEIVFGVRVVNRQSWRQLAFARGDLVGTVPLGPRESKKVSVKTTRRSKTARTTEAATSFETSAESTNTSKDTSEVVDEATKKLNKHADAEVSGGYPPFFSAKVSGGIAEDTGSSSKQTKSNLNEMMQKTASRMKRDTKVTVSTEAETTFEQIGSSELVNPNDEIAVTYLYHRLQQRFWVSTEIAEVNSVLLVPEPIPEFNAVNEDWIRAHGEIIASALLDNSFASAVAAIRSEPDNLDYLAPPGDMFTRSADTAITSTHDYQNFIGGGALPDMLSAGQQYYERDYERRAALAMDQARRRHQTAGLLAHLRRNILYYMRAIWADEDPDQRLQRYSRLRVPVMWTFVPRAPMPPGTVADERLDVDGVFMPAGAPATRRRDRPDRADRLPIQLLDLAGPRRPKADQLASGARAPSCWLHPLRRHR
jgi:hypothetical protein